jgi:o-succinylbenzoate synthase
MLQVTCHPYDLRFKHIARTSRGDLATRRIYLMRAWDTTNPSVIGWGECGPVPGLSLDDRPDFDAAVAAACAAIAGSPAHPLIPSFAHPLPAFTFGLETAIRDLQTGGRQRLWDTLFARGVTGLPTHGLIWMDTVDGLLRQIDAKLAAGFSVIKMKVGALPLVDELHLLSEIRRAFDVDQVELRLDANGAFVPDTALDSLERLAAFDITFLEQPIRAGQWAQMAEICRLSPIPIALDEDLIPVVDGETRSRLLDRVQPQHLIIKPALLGGFGASEAWIAEATGRGIQWWINSLLESNIGLNAICQWASAIGGKRVHGLGTGTLFENNIASPIRLRGCEIFNDKNMPWGFPAPTASPLQSQ